MTRKNRFPRHAVLRFLVLAGTVTSTIGASAQSPYDQVSAAPVGVCHISGPGTPRYEWEGIFNDSTSSPLYADCGLTSHWYALSSYNFIDAISVSLNDWSSTLGVSCSARLVSWDGSGWIGAAQTTTNSNGTSHLWWTPIDEYGDIYVGCTIPRRTGPNPSGLTNLYAIFW
jgi:hypothetical protein